MAKAKEKIFEVDPAKWIVAHRGMVKEATASETPFFLVWRRVTGIVAAEEEVPRAVRYAGSMVSRALSGFLRPMTPATMNWMARMTTSRMRTTTTTFNRAFMTEPAAPV